MIADMFNRGALPTLERLVQFTGARHRVLVDNIANLSTPYYKSHDLDPKAFQASLEEAVDRRREGGGALRGPIQPRDTADVRFTHDAAYARDRGSAGIGGAGKGMLYHDQNNRDLERLMQNLAENGMMHNAAVDMIRNQFASIQIALRERL